MYVRGTVFSRNQGSWSCSTPNQNSVHVCRVSYLEYNHLVEWYPIAALHNLRVLCRRYNEAFPPAAGRLTDVRNVIDSQQSRRPDGRLYVKSSGVVLAAEVIPDKVGGIPLFATCGDEREAYTVSSVLDLGLCLYMD